MWAGVLLIFLQVCIFLILSTCLKPGQLYPKMGETLIVIDRDSTILLMCILCTPIGRLQPIPSFGPGWGGAEFPMFALPMLSVFRGQVKTRADCMESSSKLWACLGSWLSWGVSPLRSSPCPLRYSSRDRRSDHGVNSA